VELKEGQQCLDLYCGTGLKTHLVKQAFGPAARLSASLLADGKLIVDVLVEEAMLGGTVSEQVWKEADLLSELSYRLNSSSVDSLSASEASHRFGKSVKYSQIRDLKSLNSR